MSIGKLDKSDDMLDEPDFSNAVRGKYVGRITRSDPYQTDIDKIAPDR